MTLSRQEEIISGIWAVAAIISFGFDYYLWGWVFTTKAIIDAVCSIYFAFKEPQNESND